MFPCTPKSHQTVVGGYIGRTDGQWLEVNRLPVTGYALGYSWSPGEGNWRGGHCWTLGQPLEAPGPLLWRKTTPPGSFRCSCERRQSDGEPAKRSRCGRVCCANARFKFPCGRRESAIKPPPWAGGPAILPPLGWGVRFKLPRGLGGPLSNFPRGLGGPFQI